MNPLFDKISPSVIRAINDKKRPDSIDLGMGQPLLKPAMAPLQQALAWVEANGCPYSPNLGFPELRTAIARHFGYPGLDTAETTCVTVGSQEALYLAIKGLLNPTPGPEADEVLVVTPAFPAYQKLCLMEGIPYREVSLDPDADFAADAARVLAAVTPRTRLVVLASPNNPTGRIWPESELRKLAAGLSALPRPVYLLSDEVYSELYFTDAPPVSPARFYPRTMVAGSLSKSCALTGLRLGWLLTPREVAAPMWKAHQFAVSCADTVAQRAALEIFQSPAYLTAHLPHYRAQYAALVAALDASGLSYVRPEGAFYCLVRVPAASPWARDTMGLSLAVLERENVVIIPGSAFGAEGFVRLSFVASPEALAAGIARLGAFLR